MPDEFLAEVQKTLVTNIDASEILCALKTVTKSFFSEARNLDKMLGLDAAAILEAKMLEYIDSFY